MKFNQLRALAAVAKTGSIQKAARDLHLSQPALSKSVRELERQLGVPLLVRGAGGATLTPYGAVVAKRFQAIQKEVDKVQEEIDWLRGELRGRLLIGVSPVAAGPFLAETIAQFRCLQPAIEIQILELRPGQIMEGLRSGLLDFGILHRYGLPDFADFHCVTLQNFDTILAIGGRYPANRISIEVLRGKEWLASDLADDPDGYALVLARQLGEEPPPHIVRCTSISLYLELASRLHVVSHWAETALPYLDRCFRDGTMTRLTLDSPLPQMNVALVYQDEDLLSPAAALLVRMLRAAVDKPVRGDE